MGGVLFFPPSLLCSVYGLREAKLPKVWILCRFGALRELLWLQAVLDLVAGVLETSEKCTKSWSRKAKKHKCPPLRPRSSMSSFPSWRPLHSCPSGHHQLWRTLLLPLSPILSLTSRSSSGHQGGLKSNTFKNDFPLMNFFMYFFTYNLALLGSLHTYMNVNKK